MLPPGNTLKDLFVYADLKWTDIPDAAEKQAMKAVLAEDLFGLDPTAQRRPGETRFTESQLLTWMRAVKRVAAGEPLQYVTGKAAFFGRMFAVTPAVLIPRPETEELLALVLERYPEGTSLKAIDFCTGSGCIPVTLKKERPAWEVEATEISTDALEVARKNAATFGAGLQFREGDFLSDNGIPEGTWDLMLSNPPYIAQSEDTEMAANVLQHEPHLALFVPDEDPLRFYRRLAEIAAQRLNRNGRVFAELNPRFAEACRQLFLDRNLHAKLHKDLSGKWRFLEIEN